MQGQRHHPYLDWWISELATRQHGVVAWFQLRDAGVSRGLVDFRLAAGRLHIVHRGVYAVGHRELTLEGRRMAAVLALGPTAVLSHHSAAEHWGMLARSQSGVTHVTLPDRGPRRQRRGIAVHRVPEVQATVHDGIPVTTVPWTLLDLAATAQPRILDRAIEGAERARLLDLKALQPLLAEVRPGVRALREALAAYDDAPTESELERRFLELCTAYDIPRPHVNQWLLGRFQVDFLWPEHRLIVETDGMAWHGTSAARKRDHKRDAELALAGFYTQRFDWEQVTQTPAKTAELVLQLLAERDPSSRSPWMPGKR